MNRTRNRSRGGGAASAPPVLFDTFTDANGTLITAHTPDIGSAATSFVGTEPQIQSNAMVAMAAGTNRAEWDPGITGKELASYSSVNANIIVYMIRYVDVSNRYYAIRGAAGLFQLVEVIGGVTVARDNDPTSYVAGEAIKIVDDTTEITVTLTSNGIDTVLSYATTLLNTETGIAVQLNDATTSIDYILVRAL